MKTATPVIKVPFHKLIDLFIQKSEHRFILDPLTGNGSVQIFEVERGLQARFWDCCFNQEIQTYSELASELDNSYFTLAFFLNMQGLQFTNRGTVLPENIIWDTVFISAVCDYKIHVALKTTVHCMSISFSKKWLNNNVFEDNEAFDKLKGQLNTIESCSILESMTSSEKKVIQELLEASWEKSFGSFYIKSAVLKIVCDFFYKLKAKQTFNKSNVSPGTSIVEVERYLCDHLLLPLPNLKHLAGKFSVSEPTLKRHFKKRYGVNMSTYFTKKKMEYAQQLMHEKDKSVRETAFMLGYKHVNNFIAMFKKHIKSGLELSTMKE